MLYSNGMACCVVVGGRAFIYTTPYGIGGVDFRGKDAVYLSGGMLFWKGFPPMLALPLLRFILRF